MMTTEPLAWMERAACLDTGDLMFPASAAEEHQVKRNCRSCPVLQPCLELALEQREQHGVWGGMTAHERRMLKKQRV